MASSSQFCTFCVGDHFFGIDVQHVQEVLRYQQMTHVPLASRVVEGLINLRGQIVTAIDMRRRLSMEERPAGSLPMNVVLTASHGAISLLVDEIGDVLEVSDEDFEATPETLDAALGELVRGVYKLPDRLLLVLDAGQAIRLFDAEAA